MPSWSWKDTERGRAGLRQCRAKVGDRQCRNAASDGLYCHKHGGPVGVEQAVITLGYQNGRLRDALVELLAVARDCPGEHAQAVRARAQAVLKNAEETCRRC